jgi:hypothetical protein
MGTGRGGVTGSNRKPPDAPEGRHDEGRKTGDAEGNSLGEEGIVCEFCHARIIDGRYTSLDINRRIVAICDDCWDQAHEDEGQADEA